MVKTDIIAALAPAIQQKELDLITLKLPNLAAIQWSEITRQETPVVRLTELELIDTPEDRIHFKAKLQGDLLNLSNSPVDYLFTSEKGMIHQELRMDSLPANWTILKAAPTLEATLLAPIKFKCDSIRIDTKYFPQEPRPQDWRPFIFSGLILESHIPENMQPLILPVGTDHTRLTGDFNLSQKDHGLSLQSSTETSFDILKQSFALNYGIESAMFEANEDKAPFSAMIWQAKRSYHLNGKQTEFTLFANAFSTEERLLSFETAFDQSQPLLLSELPALLAGEIQSSLVPEAFPTLDNISLQTFGFDYDLNEKTITSAHAEVRLNQTWSPIEGIVTFSDFGLWFGVASPPENDLPAIALRASCLASIYNVELEASISFPELSFSASMPPDKPISVKTLIQKATGQAPDMPDLEITGLTAAGNLSQKSFLLVVEVTTDWSVDLGPLNVKLDNVDIGFRYEAGGCQVFGGVGISTDFLLNQEVLRLEALASFDLNYMQGLAGGLAIKGTLIYRNITFDLAVDLSQNASLKARAQNLSLKEIALTLLDIELPPELPNVVIKDLAFVYDKEKVQIEGEIQLENPESSPLKLGNEDLPLGSLKFHFTKHQNQGPGDENITAYIEVKGQPSLEIGFFAWHAFQLSFAYSSKGWELKGDTHISLAEGPQIKLGASYKQDKEVKYLELEMVNESNQPLLQIPKVAQADLKKLKLAVEVGKKSTNWSFEGAASLKINEPGQESALFELKEANLTLAYDGIQKQTTFDFQAAGNQINFTGLASLAVNQLKIIYKPGQLNLSVTGGMSIPILATALQQNQSTISGSLKLQLKAGENEFSFEPENFQFNTPPISYQVTQEVVESNGALTTKTIPKRFCATAALKLLKVSQKDGWSIEGAATMQFQDVPEPLNLILHEKLIEASCGFSKKGAFVEVKNPFEALVIPDLLAPISQAMPELNLPALGDSCISLSRIRLALGSETGIELEAGLGLPADLNSALGLAKTPIFRTYEAGNYDSLIRASLTLSTKKISGKVLNSPIDLSQAGIEMVDGEIVIDFDKLFNGTDLGMITLELPEIGIDMKKGSLKLKAGYKIDPERGLALPLTPLKQLLKLIELEDLSKSIPDSFPINEIDLNLKALIEQVTRANVDLPPEIIAMVDEVEALRQKLPARFLEYLKVKIPQSLSFDIDISGDQSFSLAVNSDDGIQLLIPTGPQLTGIRLKRLGAGTALGGKFLKVDTSIEIDQFNPITLLGSLLLLDEPYLKTVLPGREQLQQTLIIEEFLLLILIAKVPIPIPLFYENIELKHVGLEGLEFHSSINFPQPTFNIMKALSIINDVYQAFSTGKDLDVEHPMNVVVKPGNEPATDFNIVFRGGPLYLKLPKYLGTPNGEQILIGLPDKIELLNLLNLAGILFNTVKNGSPGYLIRALPLDYRFGTFHTTLFDQLTLKLAYVLATPKEFVEIAHMRLGEHINPEAAGEMLKLIPGPAQSDDNDGVVMFTSGSMNIEPGLSLQAASAFVLDRNGIGMGMLIKGNIGKETLTFKLMGLTQLDLAKKNVLVQGDGDLYLLGNALLKGKFYLEKDRFEISATADLTSLNSPIKLHGSLKGQLTNECFEVKGKADLWLCLLKVRGESHIKVTSGSQLISLSGNLQLGSFASLDLAYYAQGDEALLSSLIQINGELLNTLALDFSGQIVGSGTELSVSSKGKLSMKANGIENTLCDFDLQINKEAFRLEGNLNLFPHIPGLSFIAEMEGTLKQEIFTFSGQSQLNIGPFSIQSSLALLASPDQGYLRLQSDNFFGQPLQVDIGTGNGQAEQQNSGTNAIIRLTPGSEEVNIKSQLPLGAHTKLNLVFQSERSGTNLTSMISFHGKILNVIAFDFDGQIVTTENGFVIDSRGQIKLFDSSNDTVLCDFRLHANNTDITIEGNMDLFKGIKDLDFIASMKGHLHQNQFAFNGSSTFRLGPFKSESTLSILSGPTENYLKLQLVDFLGTDLTFQSQSSSNGIVIMTGQATKPLSLLFGILKIGSATDLNGGPSGELSWKKEGIQHMYLDGAASILGLTATARLNYQHEQLHTKLQLKAESFPLINADFQLETWLRHDYFKAQTSLALQIDIGAALQAIVKAVTGIDPGKPNLSVGFGLNELSIEVDKHDPKYPEEDPNFKGALDRTNETINALRRNLKDPNRNLMEGVSQLKINRGVVEARIREAVEGSLAKKLLQDKFKTLDKYCIEIDRKELERQEQLRLAAELESTVKHDLDPSMTRLINEYSPFENSVDALYLFSKEWKEFWKRTGRQDDYYHRYDHEYLPRVKQTLLNLTTYRPTNIDHLTHEINTYSYRTWHHDSKWFKHNRDKLMAYVQSVITPYLNHVAKIRESINNTRNHIELHEKKAQALMLECRLILQNSDALMMIDGLDTRMQLHADKYQREVQSEQNIDSLFGNVGMASSDGYRITFKTSLEFQLPGMSETLTLPKIQWTTDCLSNIDFSKPFIELLPQILINELGKNLFNILMQAFGSALRVLEFLGRLLTSAAGMGSLSSAPSGDQLIAAMGELNLEEAKIMNKVYNESIND